MYSGEPTNSPVIVMPGCYDCMSARLIERAGRSDATASGPIPIGAAVHTGDAFVRYFPPFIDQPSGGSLNGLIDAAAAGLLDGTELIRYSASLTGDELTAHEAFWFAWSQFHPETMVWAP